MSSEAPEYDNPETKEALDEARKQLQEEGAAPGDDEVEETDPGEAAQARRQLAREEPMPDADGEGDDEDARPDLRVRATVEFRGREFEFTELGASELEASKFSDIEEGDVEQGTEAGKYVYKILGRHGVNTDADYWRRYSLQPAKGQEGVMTLFNKVIAAFNEDVDVEDIEAAGN